jgi:hypothetical protein
MENIDLENALNAGAYHPEGTPKSYSLFSLAMEKMFMVI